MGETGKDIGYRILELESRLSAYRKVHAEELDELQQLLSNLKEDVLASRGGGEEALANVEEAS